MSSFKYEKPVARTLGALSAAEGQCTPGPNATGTACTTGPGATQCASGGGAFNVPLSGSCSSGPDAANCSSGNVAGA